MNYYEYFLKCRNEYQQEQIPSLDEFYTNPVVEIPIKTFSDAYAQNIDILAKSIKKDFDSRNIDDIMLKHDDIWKYEQELEAIADILVPYLEKNRYGCHLYVDKVYIYRTVKFEKRQSSYLWHYDNNPAEIVKNIIYLNDVNEKNSPFEYMADSNKKGLIIHPTRTGPDNWQPAPNNSRITEKQLRSLNKKGFFGEKVLGKKGLTYSFCNDIIHRANPIVSGYRDVLNIRVNPAFEKPPHYINRRWTTGFETSGVVEKDPEISWKRQE